MMKHILPAAVFALCAASPLAAFDIDAMSEAERAAFRAEIRAYLMDNPEVLLEAIEVLEARQMAEQAAADVDLVRVNAEDIFNDGYSFVGGNPEGDVTIVEFLDYRCGYCKRAHPEVAELIASDGNIRLIVKEYPILGEDSLMAAHFAIAVRIVAGADAYAAVNDALMTMRGNVSEAALVSLADRFELDTDAVMIAMAGDAVREEIARNRALAQRLAINGTPSFIFEDQMVRGYVPLDGMREIVSDLRTDG